MSDLLRFEVDEITVKDIERRLGSFGGKAPNAMKNALNDTAKDARTDLWAKANATYSIKKGGFNRDMRIIPASTSTLEAVLVTRGAPIEMIKFSVRNRKGTPSVEILRGRVKSMGKRSFVNNVAHNGHHLAVAKYIGGKDSRLKIQKKFSVSSPQMIGNEQRVYGIVEPNILKNLQKNVDRQILMILARG